jgi:hypothetical protein
MARELITKNEIANENWMYTVSANAESRMSYRIEGSAMCPGQEPVHREGQTESTNLEAPVHSARGAENRMIEGPPGRVVHNRVSCVSARFSIRQVRHVP